MPLHILRGSCCIVMIVQMKFTPHLNSLRIEFTPFSLNSLRILIFMITCLPMCFGIFSFRGKCQVKDFSDIDNLADYLEADDSFFYRYGYKPESRCVCVCVCVNSCLCEKVYKDIACNVSLSSKC